MIGLGGYAQSGKDTVAGILRDLYGYQRIAFADALKKVAFDASRHVYALFDHENDRRYLPLRQIIEEHGWEAAKQTQAGREFLQALGVAGREHIQEDVWVDAAFHNAPPGLVVVSDMRFPNEFAKVKARGGVTWRVIREGVNAANAHISETALDDHVFDEHIYNSSSRAALADKVIDVLDIYMHAQRAGERVTSG